MQRGHVPGQNHTRRKQVRHYVYAPADQRLRRRAITIVFSVVLVFSAWQLIDYGIDYLGAHQASNKLRELYYSETEEPAAEPTPTPDPTPTPAPTATSDPAGGPTPEPTPVTELQALRYPGNLYNRVSSRFQKLQRQNKDIIGWLTIPSLLDEAVVQKDNSYYLRRDYRGYHNVNGSLFLDENIELNTRPYTLTIYGHNMKTGAMFGCLRNYENLHFYQQNPFLTFDTMYEDGKYVIFSITELSLNAKDYNYFSFGKVNSDSISRRAEAIDVLKSHSLYSSSIEVLPEDQLLLLVTCVDNDEERRIVAARRIRDDETEEELQRKVNQSRKW